MFAVMKQVEGEKWCILLIYFRNHFVDIHLDWKNVETPADFPEEYVLLKMDESKGTTWPFFDIRLSRCQTPALFRSGKREDLFGRNSHHNRSSILCDSRQVYSWKEVRNCGCSLPNMQEKYG